MTDWKEICEQEGESYPFALLLLDPEPPQRLQRGDVLASIGLLLFLGVLLWL